MGTKKLDTFAKLEQILLPILFFVMIVGGLLGVPVFLFPKKLPWWFAVPIFVGFAILWLGLGIWVLDRAEIIFQRLRKHWGLKPRLELEREIREELQNAEYVQEEREKHGFQILSMQEQLYAIWSIQRQQVETLNALRETFGTITKWLFVAAIALAVYLIGRKFD